MTRVLLLHIIISYYDLTCSQFYSLEFGLHRFKRLWSTFYDWSRFGTPSVSKEMEHLVWAYFSRKRREIQEKGNLCLLDQALGGRQRGSTCQRKYVTFILKQPKIKSIKFTLNQRAGVENRGESTRCNGRVCNLTRGNWPKSNLQMPTYNAQIIHREHDVQYALDQGSFHYTSMFFYHITMFFLM